MELNHTLKELTELTNELIVRVSKHAAIISTNVPKKEEPMDVDCGDLTDQIDLANNYVAEIDNCIRNIYQSVKHVYSKRLPELKISDPMQYILTVRLLGNNPNELTDSIKSELSEFLEARQHLLVTMTASTSQGVKLEPEDMINVIKACEVAVHTNNLRTKLLKFVELNMATIAPNLSVIVGAPIAAKLMGLAGGLTHLATMPSCNIAILGSRMDSDLEANVASLSRVGIIYDCDLIRKIPFDHTKDVRKRAVRWVANKCVLAARCDISRSDSHGEAGVILRDKIISLINKELEPPPKKAPRPLPAPIDKSGKRRGGRRVRRMRERYATTELRKAVNRIKFGDVGDDAYQNDLGFGRTQLNAIQKLRGPQINQKTKVRLSKSSQKRLATENRTKENPKGQQLIAETSVGGIVLKAGQQSLAIYNPEARESFTAGTSGESSNYFSNASGFTKVKTKVSDSGN